MISEEELPLRQDKSYLFKCLLLANFLQYLEAGAVPALLLQLSISFNMGSAKQGLLGGVVYLSLSLGGPVAGYLLRNFEHKTVISCAVAANMFFTLIWALTPVGKSYSTNMFITVRFIMGLCQCVVCAFLPLWTNENAPKKYRTSWMSYLQASVPFGVMTGYIIASILTELSNHRTTCFGLLCWRWSFLIEIILLTPLYLGLYLIPKEDIQVCAVKRLAGSGGKGSVGTASGSSRDIASGTAAFIGSTNRRNITGDIEAPIPHRVVKPRGDAAVYDSPSGAVSTRRKHGSLTPDERRQCSSLRKTAMSASLYDSMAARYAFKKSCDNISLLGPEDSGFPALPGLRRYETEDDLTNAQQQLLPPPIELASSSNSKIRASTALGKQHRRSPRYARLGQSHHSLPEGDSLSEEEGHGRSGEGGRGSLGSGEGGYFLGPTVEEDIVVAATSRRSPAKIRKARSRSSDAAIPGSQQARARLLHPQPQTKTTEPTSPPGASKRQSLQDWLLGGLSGLSYATSTARPDRRASSDSQPLLPTTSCTQDTGVGTGYGAIPKSTGSLRSKRHSFDQRHDPERRHKSSPKLSGAPLSRTTPEPVEYESFRDLTRKNSIGSSRGKHRASWGMFSLLGYNNPGAGGHSRGNSRRNSFNERPFSSNTTGTSAARRSTPPQPRSLSRTSRTSSPHTLLMDNLTGVEAGLGAKEGQVQEEDYPVCRRFSADDMDLEPYLEEELESPSPVPLKERFRAVSNPARVSSPLSRNIPSQGKLGGETSINADQLEVEDSPEPDDEFSEDADCSASEDDISYSPSDSCSEDDWDDLTPPRANQHGYYNTPPSRVAFTPISTGAVSFPASGGLTMSGGSKRGAAATPGSVAASVVAIARASQAAEEEDNRSSLESVARWCRHTYRYLVSVVESVRALLAIKTYRYLLGAMSALYFTVTGVQFWGTKYLTVALHAPLPLVNTLFILCAATGPTLGVFFGGWIVDLNGGYKGAHQRVVALEMCATFGVLACILSLPITLLSNIFVVVGFLWVVLFFGGAMLPACSGIVVSIIPRAYRPTSSALALMVFNMFGYFMSLLLSGLLMQYLDSHREGCDEVCSMTWGFRLVLFWSFLSVAFLLLALFAAYQHLKDRDRGHGRSSSIRRYRRPASSKKLHTAGSGSSSLANIVVPLESSLPVY